MKPIRFAILAATTFLSSVVSAESKIDPKLCTAGFVGFDSFIQLRDDGQFLMEGSKFYEKRDTSLPFVKEFHFRSKNKVWLDDDAAETKSIMTRLLTDRDIPDFLTVERDSQGRIVSIAAQSKDPSSKQEAMILTEEGWESAPIFHQVKYRYQGNRCLKTLQVKKTNSGRLHLVYSEEFCDQLFPLIERFEASQGKGDVQPLVAAFGKLSEKAIEFARENKTSPPVFGDPDQRVKPLTQTGRAVRFAGRCVQERGDMATWKRIRSQALTDAQSASGKPGHARKAD